MRGPSAGRSLLLGWALLVGGLPACQSGQAAGPDAVGGRPGAHTAPQTSAPPRGAASPQTASPEAASAQGTTDAGTRSDLPRARVYVKDAFGGAHRVEVEVAATPESRQQGLMYRRELPPGTGMLFVFPTEAVQSFWMKNTLLPLDMLFIDSGGTVVGVVARAEPLTLTGRSVGRPSRYVLEVPGGWAEEHGVQTGAQAVMEGLSALPIR